MTSQPVDLAQEAASLPDLWSPRVVARVNGQFVKVAKVQGEFAWHDHEGEDELFLVLRGRLDIAFEDRPAVSLGAGEVFVVPKGVRHRTRAPERTVMLMVEGAGIVPTGDA